MIDSSLNVTIRVILWYGIIIININITISFARRLQFLRTVLVFRQLCLFFYLSHAAFYLFRFI